MGSTEIGLGGLGGGLGRGGRLCPELAMTRDLMSEECTNSECMNVHCFSACTLLQL